jgi:adenylosuccinate lyase
MIDQLAPHASPEMRMIWSPEYNVRLERQLWCEILAGQIEQGINIDPDHLHDYRAHIGDIDLDSINARELVLRHDVKARIEEFNYLAEHETIHLGLTSADIVDNVAQIKIRRSCGLLRGHYPHRFPRLADLMERYPMRGIKGAIGTQADMIDLLGSELAVWALEQRVAHTFGFEAVLANTGQIYPRSLDSQVIECVRSCVFDLRGTPGYRAILDGYASMLAGISGETWLEGDVSTSVVRRVALPGAFLAADAMLIAPALTRA